MSSSPEITSGTAASDEVSLLGEHASNMPKAATSTTNQAQTMASKNPQKHVQPESLRLLSGTSAFKNFRSKHRPVSPQPASSCSSQNWSDDDYFDAWFPIEVPVVRKADTSVPEAKRVPPPIDEFLLGDADQAHDDRNIEGNQDSEQIGGDRDDEDIERTVDKKDNVDDGVEDDENEDEDQDEDENDDQEDGYIPSTSWTTDPVTQPLYSAKIDPFHIPRRRSTFTNRTNYLLYAPEIIKAAGATTEKTRRAITQALAPNKTYIMPDFVSGPHRRLIGPPALSNLVQGLLPLPDTQAATITNRKRRDTPYPYPERIDSLEEFVPKSPPPISDSDNVDPVTTSSKVSVVRGLSDPSPASKSKVATTAHVNTNPSSAPQTTPSTFTTEPSVISATGLNVSSTKLYMHPHLYCI